MKHTKILLCAAFAAVTMAVFPSFARTKRLLKADGLLKADCAAAKSADGDTPMPGIFHWTLDNGLDVFAVENHAAPLAYIEIAVKAGGITQTRFTAGLFHLYEHMMFKGNTLYPSAAAVQKAISDLGVSDWNGTTGLECVNYFFTVPARELRTGMEFWRRAITEPLLDADELEREKKVVLSEITADTNDPSYLTSKCALAAMFPSAPWQVDPSGDPATVQNATVGQIKDIQRTYYVPNNAALFVAGDVDPGEVHRLAEELYGEWQRAAPVNPPAPLDAKPLAADKFIVCQNDKVAPGMAYITVYLRGPDVMTDEKSTYAADMTLSLFNDPAGPLVREVLAADIGVANADRVGMGYQTRRATSLLTFSAMLNLHDLVGAWFDTPRQMRAATHQPREMPPHEDLAVRVNKLLGTVRSVCADAASGKEKIPPSVFKRTLVRLEDSHIIDSESPDDVKTTLRYWWTAASADYYYTYDKKIAATKEADVRAFLARYINGKNALVIVSVNSEAYKEQAANMEAAGFRAMQKEDALWWTKASD